MNLDDFGTELDKTIHELFVRKNQILEDYCRAYFLSQCDTPEQMREMMKRVMLVHKIFRNEHRYTIEPITTLESKTEMNPEGQ